MKCQNMVGKGMKFYAIMAKFHQLDPQAWLTSKVVLPYGAVSYYWSGVTTIALAYNMITVLMRAVFHEVQTKLLVFWLVVDYLSDLIYIMDMLIKFRTGYLEQGLFVRNIKKLAKNYMRSMRFKIDVISVFPTDFLYFYVGINQPIVRLNRLLKLPCVFEFTELTETRTKWPILFRVLCLIVYILVIIHLNACLYFAVSSAIGLGSDRWVYNNDDDEHDSFAHRYFYSFYWSTMTLTTIGETPMITNMNAAKTEYQFQIDAIKQFMQTHKVNDELQGKIIRWLDYQWTNKYALNNEDPLTALPNKLQAEIAINVHYETLRKVKIFQNCEAGLLAELVLKLKLQVFSPGDYICRKGDIGKEMYIVKRGHLQVVGDDMVTVFATLKEGAVFGELSILNIPGNKNADRRTANIRSVGYTDLFVLSKVDLWSALLDFPDAKGMLIEKGKEILRKDNLLDETAAEVESPEKVAETVSENLQSIQERFSAITSEIEQQRKLHERIDQLEEKLKMRVGTKYRMDDSK
ncbi:unnamed protein product [Soboliphyme baturini]|uniref:Cyclic nucleotide-binding domain-containing protein n=1 Tax=Soboliphyme baturini TaxID=241478 RepID=A0A183IIJ6_9BILA|nr:unnamed protein product [Soboliphyme baturini]